MRQLVEADEVVLGSLIVEMTVLLLEMPEFEDRAGRKRPAMLLLVPGRLSAQPGFRSVDQTAGLRKLRKVLTEQESLVSRDIRVLDSSPEKSIGLAAASCASVQRFEVRQRKERSLLR